MPEELLLPGEIVLFVTRRHVLWLVVPLVLLLASTALIAGQSCPVALELRLDGRCPIVVGAGVFAAALPFVLDWLTTRLVLTNLRLLLLQTPLAVRTRQVPLPAIASLSVQQSLLGRLLGFGDLAADTSATEGGRISLGFVPEPIVLAEKVSAAAQRANS